MSPGSAAPAGPGPGLAREPPEPPPGPGPVPLERLGALRAAVPVTTAQMIGCTAALSWITHDPGGAVLNPGRRRQAGKAIRKAARDRDCPITARPGGTLTFSAPGD